MGLVLHLCYTQRLTLHDNDDDKDMVLFFTQNTYQMVRFSYRIGYGLVFIQNTYRFEWSVFPTGSMVRFSYRIHVDVVRFSYRIIGPYFLPDPCRRGWIARVSAIH